MSGEQAEVYAEEEEKSPEQVAADKVKAEEEMKKFQMEMVNQLALLDYPLVQKKSVPLKVKKVNKKVRIPLRLS